MLLTVLAENKTAYRNTRVEHTRTLSDTETKYYANFIEESAGDTKKLFSIINSLCKVDNRYDTLPPHHSFQILANDFGAFFIKKIELIQEDIDNIVVNQPELDSHHLHTE